MREPIVLFKVKMSEKVPELLKDVLLSGFIGQGPKVEEFEKDLRNYFNNDYILTMNSATSAEHLAIHMLKNPVKNTVSYHGVAFSDYIWPGIQEGDEALVTSLSCTATNWPLVSNGLKLKWVDIDEKNLNMDLDDLARKITPKTKVIMFVHWGGYPVDLDKVKEIQKNAQEMYGFKPAVIEDCAHAMGSTYKGKKLGNHGNLCTFSFQAIKHMNTIDGGILISPHVELYNRGKLLRWYGIDRSNNSKDFRCEKDVPEIGFKFHMNDINATVGIENLKYVDDTVRIHRENAEYYNNELKNVTGVTLLENKDGHNSSYWIYSILVDRKEDFMDYMKSCGIMVSQVHERNDKHSCVREFKTQLPTLDKTVKKLICIPVGWWITKEDREYIVECIKKGW